MSSFPFSIWSVVFHTVMILFFPEVFSAMRMMPCSEEYFIALSKSREIICRIFFSSPTYSTCSATLISNCFPFVFATERNPSAVSSTASESENDTFSSFVPSSSMRERNTSFSVREVSLAICFLVLCVHSFSPSIISMTSVLASMIVSGVLISWLASVIKRFCFS